MLLASLLLTPLLSQNPLEVRDRLVVTPTGAEVERDYRDAGGVTTVRPSSGQLPLVTSPRWMELDSGQFWICEDVDVGDSGASLIAGKGLNNEAVSNYSQGSSQQIWNYSTLGSEQPRVAVADRAPLAAGLVVTDTDPGPNFNFQGVVYAWDTRGNGTPLWSYTFPLTANYFGGGVAVSDNGQVVLAWKADPNTTALLVRKFNAAGTLTGSADLVGASFHSRQTRLSDDGSRAYFNIGAAATIFNTNTMAVEFTHNIGASFDAHALSGDGSRFAYGNFGFFRVYEEVSTGVWNQVATKSFAGGTYVGYVDLNSDGSVLGYQVQRYSPAYDHIEVGMYDVNANLDLFNASTDAPGTAYQLVTSGVRVDEDGDYVAAVSWGDSFGMTPEGFVYNAAGTQTCSIGVSGSGFGIGFDADGDLFAMGTKSVHANQFGNGGAVIAADAFDQTLHVSGYPQAGGTVNLETPAGANALYVGVCTALGSSGTPFGVSELDLTTQVALLGPFPIPGTGLSQALNVPTSAAVVGNLFHLQGGRATGPGTGTLTNKVSVRVLP